MIRTGSVASGLCRPFHRSGKVHPQHATVQFVEVHIVDGILSVRRRGIRNEGEPSVLRLCTHMDASVEYS